ncbi:hypothetical protein HLB44_14295 [Aquincola sp. S2]|uniref:Uncharacterized protein n=1 Tax=Pseudaquabacterium terrae TaxID=2732868 RepID=A0ABX2EHM9_9BURK|nr:hypothetical protein [Aquabacterium terrae]NRF68160.1 hypothetical protein [Aquabacterium terrae]
MNISNTPRRALAALLLGVVAVAPVWSAGKQRSASSEIEATFHHERDKCMSGRSHQDRATCLREAHAAYAEARAGKLGSTDDATLRRNALARCERQPAAERPACERLASGEGTRAGSVEGGGVIKELVTRTVEPQPATTTLR